MPSPPWRALRVGAPLVLIGLACGGLAEGPDAALTDHGGRCGPMAPIAFWSGEYPSPVIQVDRTVSLAARREPCDVRPSVTCEIPAGLYHPWASQGRYLTLVEPTVYRVDADFVYDDGPAMRAGQTFTVETYLSEGHCSMKHGDTSFAAPCPNHGALPIALIREPTSEPQQLFDPGCGAWLDVDSALFVRPEIQHGQITGYGEVGRTE